MPRIPRCDHPGAWFHLMNRGIARRPIFETALDMRFFQAQLARVVRGGALEVHAFCVMTTHYRLLVRSPCGRLVESAPLDDEAAQSREDPLDDFVRAASPRVQAWMDHNAALADATAAGVAILSTPTVFGDGGARAGPAAMRRRSPVPALPPRARAAGGRPPADVLGSADAGGRNFPGTVPRFAESRGQA